MRAFKTVGKATVLFVLCFTLSAWPWDAVRKTYAHVYQSVGNVVFATFGPWGRVHFGPERQAVGNTDTAIALMNRGNGARLRFFTNSRFMAYVPTVFVLSLIVATPVSWRQRGRALILGFLMVNAFVLLRLFLAILMQFSGSADVALFSPGPFWTACLGAAFSLFVVSAAGAFVVPILIWALATFRKADWLRLLSTPQT